MSQPEEVVENVVVVENAAAEDVAVVAGAEEKPSDGNIDPAHVVREAVCKLNQSLDKMVHTISIVSTFLEALSQLPEEEELEREKEQEQEQEKEKEKEKEQEQEQEQEPTIESVAKEETSETESMSLCEMSNALLRKGGSSTTMHLQLCATLESAADDKLQLAYRNAVIEHNQQMLRNPHTYNAGFDLRVAQITFATPHAGADMLHSGVKARAMLYTPSSEQFHGTSFFLCARSSINRTCQMLANGVGIIDAGYRGELMACMKSSAEKQCSEDKYGVHDRFAQICAPSLVPIFVEWMTPEAFELADQHQSERGAGGFGSTGV